MSLSRVSENYLFNNNNLSVAEQKPNTEFQPTEIGAISAEWELCSLKEVAEITRLAGAEYTDFWEIEKDGEIVSLRGQNIGENQLFLENCDRISASLSQKLIRSKLFKDDIVFPCVGSIGKAAIIPVDDKFHINQNIAKLRAKTKIHPLYLLFFLLSDITKKQIIKHNTASSQPSVLVGSLRDFLIPVPSLHEQKQIAEIITSVYEAIASTQAVIDQTRKVKQGLLQQLLTHGIGHTKFKESAIGKIPESWDVVRLSSVSLGEARNGIFKKKTDFGSGVPLINVGDTYKRLDVDVSDLDRVQASPNEISRFQAKTGDLFFVRSSLKEGGIGQCCLLAECNEPIVFECHLIRIRPNPEKLDSWYGAYTCSSPLVRKQIMQEAKTVTMTTLSQSTVENILIPYPPLEEQHKITHSLRQLDQSLNFLSDLCISYQQIKCGLMQDLLTGRVRVGGTP